MVPTNVEMKRKGRNIVTWDEQILSSWMQQETMIRAVILYI